MRSLQRPHRPLHREHDAGASQRIDPSRVDARLIEEALEEEALERSRPEREALDRARDVRASGVRAYSEAAAALRVFMPSTTFGEGIDLPDVHHVFLYHLDRVDGSTIALLR
jgi:hypothetical protein